MDLPVVQSGKTCGPKSVLSGRSTPGLRQLPLLVIALLWEVLAQTGFADPLFFPPPSLLLTSAWRMALAGELASPVLSTLKKTAAGFILGTSVGLLLGLLIGGFGSIRRSLEPLISAIYTVPKLSLLPILMLFVGIGDTAGILLIAVGCLIIVALQVGDSVRNLSPVYAEMATNYGASKFAVFRSVYLPSSLPSLFTGLRLALGRALMIAVAVEMIMSGDGIGGMIWFAWQTFAIERLFVAVLMAGFLGFAFHHVLRLIETRMVPWSEANGLK
jgi:ABC-type nitrate/sulfonate/bicarbonate transport system permease component